MMDDLISRQAAIDAAALSAAEWDGMYVQDINVRIREALEKLPPAQPEYEPVTAEDFAKTMSETSAYSYMLWHSEALTLMERQGFVICKKTM